MGAKKLNWSSDFCVRVVAVEESLLRNTENVYRFEEIEIIPRLLCEICRLPLLELFIGLSETFHKGHLL
jgi:hypothetical protein